MDDNPFLCIGELLKENAKALSKYDVPAKVLVTAITNCGIYDRYGPLEVRLASEKGEEEALEAINDQYVWENGDFERLGEQSPVGIWSSFFPDVLEAPYWRYGWAKEVAPDELAPYLENIRPDQDTQRLWRDLTQPKIEIKRQIAKWNAIAATTPTDMTLKEARIADFQRQLAELEKNAAALSGCESSGHHAAKPDGHLNHDKDLQNRANQIAEGLKKNSRQKITKNMVAKILAGDSDMDEATVLRRIRKKW